jgi:DNA topoisomerase-1
MAFRSAGYWDVTAELDASVSDEQASPPKFSAKLNSVDGKRVASGRDFDSLGGLRKPDEVLVLTEAAASALAGGLRGAQLSVASVEQKPYTRRPYPPFMTSTLQQEAGRKLRFSSERTMSIAQRLYENGYITYMRTDSTTLSETAVNAARNQARQLYGEEYVHPTARQYTRKVKNAQEAHEAIRPSGDVFQTPGQLHSALDNDEFRLYELIWQRTVASQMADARGTTLSLRIAGAATSGEQVVFSASGRTITFAGFLKAYVESLDEQAGGEADDAESRLPNLTQGQRVDATDLTADGHTTSPPARYTEASLIKSLEELGIGRPSTYSSIIKTIQDRGYVHKKGSALVPSWVAFAVIGLLEQHFGRLVDYDFTAAMEDELDEIASGNERRTNWLNNFYFGGDHGVEGSIARAGGLKKLVGGNLEEIDAREVNSIKLFSDDEGRTINVRVGRNGPYLERMIIGEDGEPTPQRANLKDELTPDELTLELAEKLFSTPQEGRSLGVDPVSGHEIVAKDGRYGPYVTEVLPPPPDEPEDGAPAKKGKKPPVGPKPRTGSLLQSMDLETVTLEDALKLLSLPRVVGVDPTNNEEITAQNGRYGPYLKRGTDSRSLANEDQMFTVTLDEALKIYSEPKRRGRQGAATPPLRELGNDPVSEKPMVIKDGRFGPYVTDGETNASLRKGDDVMSITDGRASELLADRRARGPVKKKAPAKKAAKKAPAKKAAAKKA